MDSEKAVQMIVAGHSPEEVVDGMTLRKWAFAGYDAHSRKAQQENLRYTPSYDGEDDLCITK